MGYKNVLLTLAVLLVGGCACAWTPEENQTPGNSQWLTESSVAVDSGGGVHVVYVREISSSYWKLVHRYKPSGGVFGPEQDVTPLGIKEPQARIISGPSNRVYALSVGRGGSWSEYTIFFREWNGSSWSTATQISDGASYCTSARAALDSSGSIHVVWQQTKTGGAGDIMYRKRTGGTWGSIKNITANGPGTSYGSVDPDIACDYSGSGVHVVWHDDFLNNGFQAYYAKSTDGGATWPGQAGWYQLSTGDYGKGPSVVVDRSNNVHCFWVDRFGGSANLLGYRKNTAGTWGAAVNLGSKAFERGCVDSNNVVHVIYSSATTGHTEMYHDWVSGNGLSGANENVSTGDNTCKAASGAIAVDAGNVLHCAWQERKGDCSLGPYILYSKGVYSTPPSAVTSFTATAASNSQINLAWHNPSNANFAGTVIRYRFDTYPTGPYDGNQLCVRPAAPNSNDSFSHTGLQSGQYVYYGAFAYNTDSIYGPGATAGARTASQYNDHGDIGSGGRPFALAASANGIIYTGTDGSDTVRGTFGKFVHPNGPWTNLNIPYTGRVLSLMVHSSGKVYGCQGSGGAAGTEDDGGVFWRYDPASGAYTQIYYDPAKQVQGEITEGPFTEVWFADGNLNVLRYSPWVATSASNPWNFGKPAGLTQSLVGGMEVVPDGSKLYACWIQNTAPFDLFKLNTANGAWTRITLPATLNTEYACGRLFTANDGYIYGHTTRAEGHIFRIDPKTDLVTDLGSQFPAGSWGANSKHCVGGGWAPNGRLYYGTSQDSSGNAHMFYFDRGLPAGSNNGSTDNGVLPVDTKDIHSAVYYGGRVYLGVRQDANTPRLWSFDVAGTAASPRVSDLRSMANGTSVTLNCKVVTAGFGDHFYIEEPDRTAGIKIASGAPATTGNMVSVTGTLAVVDGERQIDPTSVAVYSSGNGVPDPLGWVVRSVGGGPKGYVPGVYDGCGLNNVGLLGRVAGVVSGLGSGGWFYLDDGSNTLADEGFSGIKVLSGKVVHIGQRVIVTGISSVDENLDGAAVRQIKPRSDGDIQVLP